MFFVWSKNLSDNLFHQDDATQPLIKSKNIFWENQ